MIPKSNEVTGGNPSSLRVSLVPIIFGRMGKGIQVADLDDMHEITWYVDTSSGVRFQDAGADFCSAVPGLVLPFTGMPASGVGDTLEIHGVSEVFLRM